MKRLFVLAFLASAAPAHAGFVVFDAPGNGADNAGGTYATGVNAGGTVVGNMVDSSHEYFGFLRTPDGTLTEFSAKPFVYTHAQDINADGSVTGYISLLGNDGGRGYVRAPDATVDFFKVNGSKLTKGLAISDKGVVAGRYGDFDDLQHGFIREADGTSKSFDVGDGGDDRGTFVTAINAKAAVVGYWIDANVIYHGYLRAHDGTVTAIDVAGAGQGTQPAGITRAGDVAGTYFTGASVQHGFLRTADGTMTTFDAPGAGATIGGGTVVASINARREIAGYYFDDAGVAHGFLRKANGNFKTFDVAGASTLQDRGTFVARMNDDGLIVGWTEDDNFGGHGFVGTP
jgi:hypothetical protein